MLRLGTVMPHGEHRLEDSLLGVFTDTTHFARGDHIDAHGVSLCKREKENCEARSPHSLVRRHPSSGAQGSPSTILVARSMKLSRNTLLTKGKLREAPRLHSITLISLPRARN